MEAVDISSSFMVVSGGLVCEYAGVAHRASCRQETYRINPLPPRFG